MLIHAEVPPLPAVIENAYLPIFGHYRASGPEPVSIFLNGRPLEVSVSPRGDLKKVYPDQYAEGFYAVAVPPNGAWGSAKISVTIGGTEILRQNLRVGRHVKKKVAASRAARESNREFVLRHLMCVACSTPFRSEIQPDACAHCGTRLDVSTEAVSAVPLGAYAIPKTINTSFCGYGHEETALIEQVRAKGGRILDFGAGLRPLTDPAVISLEIADMPSIDVVSIGDRIPFEDNTFDGAMTLHVLEHVEKPWEIAAELMRVVKPGAPILSTVPYICPVHGFPYHFFSMTPQGLRTLFSEAEVVSHEIRPDGHPINGIKQLLGTYYGSLHGVAREHFAKITVDDIVNGDLGELLRRDWAEELPMAARWEMPAHSTLLVRKPH
jgi:SAM-dependent methyltransferase